MRQIELVDTTVVLLTFNRPNLLRNLLTTTEHLEPLEFLVFSDGPRTNVPSDSDAVLQCRGLLDTMGWANRARFFYSETNNGIRRQFDHAVREFLASGSRKVIFLEDDVHPNPDFFVFASELLKQYEEDRSVGMIQGGNLHEVEPADGSSYFGTYRMGIWGWATWADRLEDFNANEMATRSVNNSWEAFRSRGYGVLDSLFQMRNFSRAPELDTWDYQWHMHLWDKEMVSIAPKVNLVQNVGFGEMATHTFGFQEFSIATKPLEFPLAHPPSVVPDLTVEQLQSRRFTSILFGMVRTKLGLLIKSRISKLLSR